MTQGRQTLLLSALVGLFVLWWYGAPFLWLGLLMGLAAGLLTFALLRTGRWERLRRLTLMTLFALVTLSFLASVFAAGTPSFRQWVAGWQPGYFFPCGAGTGTLPYPTPLVMPAVFWRGATYLPNLNVWQTAIPTGLGAFFLFMLPYALIFGVFGRAFCGWLCPLGGLTEAAASGRREWWRLNLQREQPVALRILGTTHLRPWVQAARYGLLAGVVLLSFGLGFSIINIFYPVLWLKAAPALWAVGILLVVTAVALPFLTKRRVWCAVCPLGAALAPLQRLSPFRLRLDRQKCTQCLDCVRACRMAALAPADIAAGQVESGDCTRCGRCLEACSEGALSLHWPSGTRRAEGPFVALAVATVFALWVWFVIPLAALLPRLGDFRWFS